MDAAIDALVYELYGLTEEEIAIVEGGLMSKYDPLRAFLESAAPGMTEMTLSFRQIETILGFVLPRSARRHRAWWSNPTSPYDHPYAQAWLAAGWKVDTVDQTKEWVRFPRLN